MNSDNKYFLQCKHFVTNFKLGFTFKKLILLQKMIFRKISFIFF